MLMLIAGTYSLNLTLETQSILRQCSARDTCT